jgi:uncharacterized YigZ family protein
MPKLKIKINFAIKTFLSVPMLPDDTYKTISGESKGSYKEKGSKFLAFAFPVISEEEIREKLVALRKEYHDARHHCYAYRLGFDGTVYRINDDGEPSGTAGRPIYGQIASHDLTRILVVVIRYFGGIKLGVPGLINAYKTATKDALDKTNIILKTIHEQYEVSFEYNVMNSVMKVLKEEDAVILKQEFGNSCKLVFSIRRNSGNKICSRLQKISNVSVTLQRIS